jgi:ribosomal protein L35
MPKMKNNKAAARRFKITGTGKILRRQAGRRHINEWKSPDKKRNLRGWAGVAPEFETVPSVISVSQIALCLRASSPTAGANHTKAKAKAGEK